MFVDLEMVDEISVNAWVLLGRTMKNVIFWNSGHCKSNVVTNF